ncbi:MAG: YicC/YloC family endoribonuclease [Desulfotomaculales bacterium]
MLRSMTGYGRGEALAGGRKFTVEIRSVNHRFCEINVRVPRFLLALEDGIRRLVAAHIARGRVDVYLTVEEGKGNLSAVKVDKALVLAYYKALEEVKSVLGLPDAITLEHLLGLPHLFVTEPSPEEVAAWWPAVEESLKAALAALTAAREAEGQALRRDLVARLARLEDIVAGIARRAPEVPAAYRRRLAERVAELGEGMADPVRLAQEVAFLAERADITEELVRLKSHLAHVKDCLNGDGSPVGRRLDFLAQEMFREINTTGAKAQDETIARLVVDFKTELEKVREQMQNIE